MMMVVVDDGGGGGGGDDDDDGALFAYWLRFHFVACGVYAVKIRSSYVHDGICLSCNQF